MSEIGLHWTVPGALSVLLAIVAPGGLAGALVGARVWPTRRVAGAAAGGLIGTVAGATLVAALFGVRLPMGI